jgi:uncharacterized protein DUF4231
MNDAEKTPSNEQLPSPLQKQASDALQFYDKLIHDFKDRADRHKRTFKLLRYSSVSLAIAVTLGSTLTATQGVFLWVIPILSGLSALSTTLLSSTNSQERWVHSRGVQQQLEAEKFLYVQHAGRYATSDDEANVRLFSERLVEIWSEGQQGWAQSVTKVSQEPPSNR